MNLTSIIIIGLIVLAIIIYFLLRNQKDERDFEYQLKNDYQKMKDEETKWRKK